MSPLSPAWNPWRAVLTADAGLLVLLCVQQHSSSTRWLQHIYYCCGCTAYCRCIMLLSVWSLVTPALCQQVLVVSKKLLQYPLTCNNPYTQIKSTVTHRDLEIHLKWSVILHVKWASLFPHVRSQVLSWTKFLRFLKVMKISLNGCFYRVMPCSCGMCSSRVSVCLAQVGVLLKRLNIGSHKQRRTIAQGL